MPERQTMNTDWEPKSVKSTFGYTGGFGVTDIPPQNRPKDGSRFVANGIDSAEQSEAIDNTLFDMYGNLAMTQRGTK